MDTAALYQVPSRGIGQGDVDHGEVLAESTAAGATVAPFVGAGAAIARGELQPGGLQASASVVLSSPTVLNVAQASAITVDDVPVVISGPAYVRANLDVRVDAYNVRPGNGSHSASATILVKSGDQILHQRVVDALDDGGVESFIVSVPPGQSASITHTVVAQAEVSATSAPTVSAAVNILSRLDFVGLNPDFEMLSATLDEDHLVSFRYHVTDPIDEPLDFGVFLSADETFDEDDTSLGTITIADVAAGEGIDQWPAAVPFQPDRPFALIVADPGGRITEANERNNVIAVGVMPLVVNVITHGWNANGIEWEEFESSLANMAAPGSRLAGRTETYVSNWNSDGFEDVGGFTKGFLALAASKIFATPGPFYHPRLATILRMSAPVLARSSGVEAERAAKRIAEDVRDQYLIDPEISDDYQVIHLIGHSRGAAVNSSVSRWLARWGYDVDQFTALDGFSRDFCGDAGLIGDIPITEAIADRRVNYRVMNGLATGIAEWALFKLELLPSGTLPEWVDAALTAWLGDIQAPPRAGFENTLIGMPNAGSDLALDDPSGTNHLNIGERYMKSAALGNYPPTRQFILDNYAGWNRFDGTSLAESELHAGEFVSNDATSPCASSSPNVAGAPDLDIDSTAFGPHDGSFEELGDLLGLASELSDIPTSDPFTNYWTQTARDEAYLLSLTWEYGGDVHPRQTDDNTFLELRGPDAFLRQFVQLPDELLGLTLDISVSGISDGRLDVLFDGQILSSVALADMTEAPARVALPITGRASSFGDLELRLTDISAQVAVHIDNLEFSARPLGDLTGDGLVTRSDLAVLVRNFGTAHGALRADGDLNDDGKIGIVDIAILQAAFTPTASPAAIIVPVAANANAVSRPLTLAPQDYALSDQPRIAGRAVRRSVQVVDSAVESADLLPVSTLRARRVRTNQRIQVGFHSCPNTPAEFLQLFNKSLSEY